MLLLAACSGDSNPVSRDGVVIGSGASTVAPTGDDSSGGNGSAANLPDIVTGNRPPAVDLDPGTVSELPAGVRSRLYAGVVDDRAALYFIDATDHLVGYSINADGSLTSAVANLGGGERFNGTVSRFTHPGSSRRAGVAMSPFSEPLVVSAVDLRIEPTTGIQSAGGDLAVDLQPATATSVTGIALDAIDGDWQGSYAFCDANGEQCSSFIVQLSVAGNTLSGQSSIMASDGTDLLPSAIEGNLSQRGRVVAIDFLWNTYRYDGFVTVNPADAGSLLVIGATRSETADEPVLLLMLQRG